MANVAAHGKLGQTEKRTLWDKGVGLVWAAAACLWLLLLSLRYLGLRLLPLSPRCLLRRQLALRRCVASLAFAALRFVVAASLAFTAPLLTASTLVALSGPCRRIRGS